jgi:hypothetical protein
MQHRAQVCLLPGHFLATGCKPRQQRHNGSKKNSTIRPRRPKRLKPRVPATRRLGRFCCPHLAGCRLYKQEMDPATEVDPDGHARQVTAPVADW